MIKRVSLPIAKTSLDGMNPPPAEKKTGVLRLTLTEGCTHNKCTFCDMYKGTPFEVKDRYAFRAHVNEVIAGSTPKELAANRIFIGAGNALAVETADLLAASQYALKKLMVANGAIPRRLAVYGNTMDILYQEYYGLEALRCGGICGSCSYDTLGDRRGVEVIYWGLESGNSEVLRRAGKGYDENDAGRAAHLLRDSEIRGSVMIIPGLGGENAFDDHIADTTRVLRAAQPEWITLIGLKINESTPYAAWMRREETRGANARLAPARRVEQTARLIEGLDFPTTVGLHGDDVHAYGHNPVVLGAQQISGRDDARRLAAELRRRAQEKSI